MKSENNFISSGFTKLDNITGGLNKGELVIIGGRPSMGKTAFMLSMARNMAIEQGNAVAVFSLKEEKSLLLKRWVLMETGLEKYENLEPHEKELYDATVSKLTDTPIFIDDTPALSVKAFHGKCRQLIQQHGIQVAFIDYLQLMTWEPRLYKRELEVANILRLLKDIAKELNIPIIATSHQYSSGLIARRPMLSDFSGCDCVVFEQNADVIALIYRPGYYGFTEDECVNSLKDAAEIIVAKNRNDKPDNAWLTFDKNSCKFIDKEPQRIEISEDLPDNDLEKERIDKFTIRNFAYTFDNFIEGECNLLARSVGLAVAENPGRTPFNPLFIYGNSGLGKTHLAQAIGNKAKVLTPRLKVFYISATEFARQYLDAVLAYRKHRTNAKDISELINFYQLADVLIVDDVQDFATKYGTQDFLYEILNQLQHRGKQLIFTSNKPPKELSDIIKDRLFSRFRRGLSVELAMPEYETRSAILNPTCRFFPRKYAKKTKKSVMPNLQN